MSLKKLTTNKLFYKKYPYKITSRVRGCWVIRSYGWEKCKELCTTGDFRYPSWKPKFEKDDVLLLMEKIEPYLSQVKLRFEHDFFDVYVDNTELYKELQQVLDPWIISICEPESQAELQFLLETQNSKKIVRSNLPYNRYKFKVYLRYKTDIDVRQKFCSWMSNYNEKIKAPGQTLTWLKEDSHWHWTPFLYVEDLPTLSMTALFLGNSVLKVEEFVLRNSINTP